MIGASTRGRLPRATQAFNRTCRLIDGPRGNVLTLAVTSSPGLPAVVYRFTLLDQADGGAESRWLAEVVRPGGVCGKPDEFTLTPDGPWPQSVAGYALAAALRRVEAM